MHRLSDLLKRIPSLIMLGLLALSLLPIIFSWIHRGEDWQHLREYVLPDAIINSLLLVGSVVFLASIIGIWSAWVVTRYEFPGRRLISKLLYLPLGFPAYVLAFVLIGLLDFSGPVQSYLRQSFGLQGDLLYFRSFYGLVIVLSLSLYPYIYMLARIGFNSQTEVLQRVAQISGLSRFQSFSKVYFPMLKPWWLAGCALIAMEVLADFGAVSTFNTNTFSTAIYKTWYSFDNWNVAAQLASILLLFVILFLVAESYFKKNSLSFSGESSQRLKLQSISGGFLVFVYLIFVFILVFSLFAPLLSLTYWVFSKTTWLQSLLVIWPAVKNTLIFSFSGALLLLVLSLLSASLLHLDDRKSSIWMQKFSGLGYALPGTLVAVCLMSSLSWLGFEQLIAGGAFLVILIGYLIRFFAVSSRNIMTGLEKVEVGMIRSAMVSGLSWSGKFKIIYLPMLKGSSLTAFVICFVEIAKEMPLTLMARPIGWDTLSVKIFELTSEGEWELAAIPSLILILIGGTVLWFSKLDDLEYEKY